MRRRGRQGVLSDKIYRELRRANKLTENGDHINAAKIFERLAVAAHDRGIFRHAPMLYLQAAKAYVLGGEIEAGFPLAQKGLDLLAETEQWQRLSVTGNRAIKVLKDAGFSTEAGELQAWLDSTLAGRQFSPADAPAQPGHLPPKCPFCGATIRSDEVEWIDSRSAECTYCGSAVPTDG